MPVFQNHVNPETEPETCSECETNTTNQADDEALECDICKKWICFPCSNVSRELFDFAHEKEIPIDYICQHCKVELPQIREIISYKQEQSQLSEKVNREIETNKTFRTQQETVNEQYERRLKYLEKIIEDKNLANTNFTPIATYAEQVTQIQRVVEQQETLTQRVEEQKQQSDKENSLVVYGIPEKHADQTDQMKEDFAVVKYIYNTKTTLNSRDLTQISRLGNKSKADEKGFIRPIKLTFASQMKRQEILRNNKNLVLEDDEFDPCEGEFCNDQGNKHKHIYVSPDKTQKQRDDEKALRTTLKQMRQTEPDLVIRNGKIIKKPTRARWADVAADD